MNRILIGALCALLMPAVAGASSLKQLAESPYWQRLLHLDAGGRSRVDDERFFLAGRSDPSALEELVAMRDAASAETDDPRTHPRCRYPARYRWLQQQGVIDAKALPAIRCPDYEEWRAQVNATRVSLIFPAAYMNSPSSMYGHTFLRFDPEDAESGSLWLSWALNFGANITTEDNSLLYAYKGLFGGYPGQFNMMPYYRKIQEYNRMENRDMWEYPLDLSAAEVDQLLEHVWELKDINFDYFFFDENCSFQLLELLDLIRPEARLTEGFDLHAIPADTVRAVVNAGMAGEVVYRPANRTRFDALVADFSDDEIDRLEALTRAPEQADQLLSAVPVERRQQLVQGAYDYLRLQQDGAVRDEDANRRSYRLLQLLNQQPRAPLPQPVMPTNPVNGHYSGLLRVGAGQRAERDFIELGIRAAYQDLLDADDGFPEGAELEMGELALRYYAGGNLKLELLDLVSIRSLPPRSALFSPWSWQVRAGLERVHSDAASGDNLVGQVAGGGGVTYDLNRQRTSLFALATGRLEFNDRFDPALTAGIGTNFGVRHKGRWGQGIAEYKLMQLTNGQLRQRFDLGMQWNVGRQQGLRAGYVHRQHDDGSYDNALLVEYRHHLL
ncbi:DUF4105 domain-containing protein [Motiliproteus sediminis]|uniref:Lnb N-terminal periplasmic domain-containing protein n=1 Tax=Motiliproteus sediminis TaxID=1468178 RepID=UPI001AEF9791|nr:DUF4105 domain-containing protein [Motiliproteus sediminis]